MDELIICRCENVYYSEIVNSIQNGATDMSGIKLRTRAGMGPCQGRVCQNNIKKLINNVNYIEHFNQKVRVPVRPVNLEDLVIPD